MIVKQEFSFNGKRWNRIESNENKYVVSNDGCNYIVVCEPIESERTFTEGEVIPEDEPSAEEAVEILLGGAE